MAPDFKELIRLAHDNGIEIWGWQVPHCATTAVAKREAKLLGDLAEEFELDGMIMDAEGTSAYFHGGLAEAKAYGAAMRQIADRLEKPLGISSNDIPQNIDGWLPKFNEIARKAHINFPQTYYGASPSVINRVDRAERGNAHLTIRSFPSARASSGGLRAAARRHRPAPSAPANSSGCATPGITRATHSGIGAERR